MGDDGTEYDIFEEVDIGDEPVLDFEEIELGAVNPLDFNPRTLTLLVS